MFRKGLISFVMMFAFILGTTTTAFADNHKKGKSDVKKAAHKGHHNAVAKKAEVKKAAAKAAPKKEEVKKQIEEIQEEPMDAEEDMGEE